MGDEQKRRSRQIEEPVHMAQALESLINLLERPCLPAPEPLVADGILPLSTGRVYLDRLLGGGMRPGTVTLFEADAADEARPVLVDIARHADHRTLIAAHSLHWESAVLWGAAARVSKLKFASGALEEEDWADLVAVVGDLAERDVWITETISVASLRSDVGTYGVEVLAVDDIGRLAHPTRALAWLVGIAVELGVAVVATSAHLALEELRGGDQLERVGVHAERGRSTLVRADPIDMLRVEDVLVDHGTGLVN